MRVKCDRCDSMSAHVEELKEKLARAERELRCSQNTLKIAYGDGTMKLGQQNAALRTRIEKLREALVKVNDSANDNHIASNEYNNAFDPFGITQEALTADDLLEKKGDGG